MATIEKAAVFSAPGRVDSPVELKSRYENFIGGHWVAPVKGEYSANVTPATGEPFHAILNLPAKSASTFVLRSTKVDADVTGMLRMAWNCSPVAGFVHGV